jgi:hypothetical protein
MLSTLSFNHCQYTLDHRLECLPKHGGTGDNKFLITNPMTMRTLLNFRNYTHSALPAAPTSSSLTSLHHLNRETSTAGHRPPPKFSTTIGPELPSSSDFPRPSLDRRSTLWGAYQRCVSRYAVAIRGLFRPNGRQSVVMFFLTSLTLL